MSTACYELAYRRAIRAGARPLEELTRELAERGGYSEQAQAAEDELMTRIGVAERTLERVDVDDDVQRAAAVELRECRRQLTELHTEARKAMAESADGIATTAKILHLVAVCTIVRSTGRSLYRDGDDLRKRGGSLGDKALRRFLNMANERLTSQPEEEFLRRRL